MRVFCSCKWGDAAPLSPSVISVNSWVYESGRRLYRCVWLSPLRSACCGKVWWILELVKVWGVHSQEEMGPLNQLVLSRTHSISITLLKAGIKYHPTGHFSAVSQKPTFSCCLWLYVTFWHTQLNLRKNAPLLYTIHFYSLLDLCLAVRCSRWPVENSVWYLT